MDKLPRNIETVFRNILTKKSKKENHFEDGSTINFKNLLSSDSRVEQYQVYWCRNEKNIINFLENE